MKNIFPVSVVILCLLASLFGSSSLLGQETPFIEEKLSRDLNNEISGDKAFDTIRWLSHFHRIMGSQGFLDAARWLAEKSKELGLTNVQVVTQSFPGRPSWDVHSGQMWVVSPEEIKIADYEDVSVSVAIYSHSAHLTAELVDVGECRAEKDFYGVDVKGKVVLTSASLELAMKSAVWERGAAGIVSSAGIRSHPEINTPDQIAYTKIPLKGPDEKRGTWAIMISSRKRIELQELIRKSERMGQPVRVKIDIETEFREPAQQAYVWAEIEGEQIDNQDIILTAHLDEEKTSANDNGSGCANQLEVGRAIIELIQKGKIPRPKRDIVFWWPNEHWSEHQYFSDHPDEVKNMLININQDMVGAKQSMGSREQHIILTPWSIPSYLNDIIESITEYVILSNNAFLVEGGGEGLPHFSKPIYSFLGSQERYGAMVTPHSGGSDHEVFCESVIGVPGVSLTNYPDPYFHSSDDDLHNIDPTQLKRNAYIVAAAVLYIANAEDDDVPCIASEVFARGYQRIGRDLRVALQHLQKNSSGTYSRSYKEARNLVSQAIIREMKAMTSVLIFAESEGENEKFVRNLIQRIKSREKDLLSEINHLYFLVNGAKSIPRYGLTGEEKEMASHVPVNHPLLTEYFKRRGWSVGPSGSLNSLMAKECYNFVDGRNSFLDIYNAVHAQAMSVGKFLYGEVTLEDVRNQVTILTRINQARRAV